MVGYDLGVELTTAREKLLQKAVTKGVVSQFDGGNDCVWFNGKPGAELRALRNELVKEKYNGRCSS